MVVIMCMRMMAVIVIVIVRMAVRMCVLMIVGGVIVRLMSLDPRFALTAAANRTHHATSNSLIRISSPPVTCN